MSRERRFIAIPRVLAILAASSLGVPAYVEDQAARLLQPFLGGWMGLYQIDDTDLDLAVEGANDFDDRMPAAGLTAGVSYKRLQVGLSLGYQPRSSGNLSRADQIASTRNVTFPDGNTVLVQDFANYSFDVTPVEGFIDISVAPNPFPVNLFLGASLGVAMVDLVQPVSLWTIRVSTTAADTVFMIEDDNGVDPNNFITSSFYGGARINLANRLNLSAQAGWRILRTDEVRINAMEDFGGYWAQGGSTGYVLLTSSTGVRDSLAGVIYNLTPRTFDLSGLMARVDLRWTFGSIAERERERDRRRTERRAREGSWAALATPPRGLGAALR